FRSALLINSDRVAVNISSIAVEAILLGKMPQIYGWPPYRYVYDCARRKSLNQAEVIDYFASVMSVSRFACQHRYGIGWIIALFVFRIINKLLGLVVKNL